MSSMRLATFKVDVTPPVGAQMAYDVSREVDTPIFVRGLVLDDLTSRAVLVSCDFIGIYGRTWFDWRQAVADAAGTEVDMVFLHSIHQHDSMCGDAELRALPVGLIDPLLRTIAFAEAEGRLIAVVDCYASHPMAAYRREMVSEDVPGVALKEVERAFGEEPFNLYLTGCAGNVTFGKYHLGDKEQSLAVLGGRLGKGTIGNLRRLEARPLGAIDCRTVDFGFPLNPEITEARMREALDKGGSRTDLLRAARNLEIARNWDDWRRCSIHRLSLGDAVHLLSLPGEVCVEYQLYAQTLVPERFLACAACGNGTYAYIPTARMYDEGGYEPNSSIGTPAVEPALRSAIRDALEALQ